MPLPPPASPQAKAKAYMQAVIDHKRCVPFLRYNGEAHSVPACVSFRAACLPCGSACARAQLQCLPGRARGPAVGRVVHLAGGSVPGVALWSGSSSEH